MSIYDRMMAGLLGQPDDYGVLTQDDLKGAKQKAAMSMAAQLLQASGPSDRRIGLGQALGSSILAGQQAQGQASQDALQAMLLKSQIAKAGQQRGKPVAIIRDGKPVYVTEEEALGGEPFSPIQRAEAPAILQEYQQYSADEKASGRTPRQYMDWLPVRAKSNVGAPYVVTDYAGGRAAVNRTDANDVRQLTTADQEAAGAATVASATTAAKTTSEAKAQAQIDLPRVQANAEQALKTIEDFKNHPGYGDIWGWGSKVPTVPGTSQAGARTYLAQIKGKTFIEAFNSLKGAGAVTDVEGGKGSDAIARLDTAQSEADGTKALNDLEDVIKSGLDRMKNKASGGAAPARRRFNPATGKIE